MYLRIKLDGRQTDRWLIPLLYFQQPLFPVRRKRAGVCSMRVDRLLWHVLCGYGWMLIGSILIKQVDLKIWGSNDHSGTDNKGSQSDSVAGRDTVEEHYSLFDFESKNYRDSFGQQGSNKMWVFVVLGLGHS